MKNKVIEYVMNSPGNTNRAVLESLLETIIGDGGSSDNVKTIIDVDLVLDEESGFMVYEDMASNDIKLTEGEQYTVTLGEDVYTTKAWRGTEDGFEVFVLGNKQLLLDGAEDTEEPFAYVQECGDEEIGHYAIVTNGATHITITTDADADVDAGGTHNVMVLKHMTGAPKIPAEIFGAEFLQLSDVTFKAADLIGGYFVAEYPIFLADEVVRDAEEGILTVCMAGELIYFISIHQDIDVPEEEVHFSKGLYVNGDMYKNTFFGQCLLIYPA